MKRQMPRASDFPRQRLTIKRQAFPSRKVIRFDGIKGKIADSVALYTAREHHAIQIRFADGTQLHFELDPAFTVKTEYQSVRTGEVRVLKSWKPMKSEK